MLDLIKTVLIDIVSLLKMPLVSFRASKARSSFPISFRSEEETVELIRDKGYSLARFGDGEFRWIKNEADICMFQSPSRELSTQLSSALNSNRNKLLIGIPKALFTDDEYKIKAKFFWREYLIKNKTWLKEFLPQITYSNASITRPYLDYKKAVNATYRFNLVKSIWDERNVLIVEGAKTKFGVGNDLLSNASSVSRILAPAENAFSNYEEIKNAIKNNAERDTLILLCLGPTATILAADIELEELQIVDIGHLDIEYEWFKAKARKKAPVKGKYVNEVSSKGDSGYNEDPLYNKSIISTVGL